MSSRLIRTLPAAALLAAGLAAPAVAALIDGTSGPDTLVGTSRADVIHRFAGDDTISGRSVGGARKLNTFGGEK